MEFIVKEISIADTRRAYKYKQRNPVDFSFNLKSFDYEWLMEAHPFNPNEKILDVGGAYSNFPIKVAKDCHCETWVADDFGMDEEDNFWKRRLSPQQHVDAHPEIKYVLERVGNPKNSSLPKNYFDVVYSVSTLEHVPSPLTRSVWKHMAELLKPGGELIHAVDLLLPSNGGINKMVKSTLFDEFYRVIPNKFTVSHHLTTPLTYLRLVMDALDIRCNFSRKKFNVWHLCLDPEVLCEPADIGWNRIQKDQIFGFHYQRVASLLIHLMKES